VVVSNPLSPAKGTEPRSVSSPTCGPAPLWGPNWEPVEKTPLGFEGDAANDGTHIIIFWASCFTGLGKNHFARPAA
jgi:hypothetical protein